MLAALQMQYLGTLTSTFKIKDALPKLSKRFEDYYKQSLDRIREKPDLQEQIFRLFIWLLYAKPPLSVEELRQCLCIEPDLNLETPLDDLDEHVERLAAESEGLVEIRSANHHGDMGPFGDEGPTSPCDEATRYQGPVRVAHETIAAYLRTQRDEWSPITQNPEMFIFTYCARFLSLSACAAQLVEHATNCVHQRRRIRFAGPGFLPWCISNWDAYFPGRLHAAAGPEMVLRTLSAQLLRAGELRGIDPLFICVIHRWHFLDPIMIECGADAGAQYNGLSQSMVDWACPAQGHRSAGSFLGSADAFKHFHRYARNVSES